MGHQPQSERIPLGGGRYGAPPINLNVIQEAYDKVAARENAIKYLCFAIALLLVSTIYGATVYRLEVEQRQAADRVIHEQSALVIELRRDLTAAEMRADAAEEWQHRVQTELSALRQHAAEEGW